MMSCFMKEEIQDDRFPELSNEVYRLKHTEKGVAAVSKIMDEIKEAAKAEGLTEGRLKTVATFLKNGGTEEEAMHKLDASPEEIKKAKDMLEGV